MYYLSKVIDWLHVQGSSRKMLKMLKMLNMLTFCGVIGLHKRQDRPCLAYRKEKNPLASNLLQIKYMPPCRIEHEKAWGVHLEGVTIFA